MLLCGPGAFQRRLSVFRVYGFILQQLADNHFVKYGQEGVRIAFSLLSGLNSPSSVFQKHAPGLRAPQTVCSEGLAGWPPRAGDVGVQAWGCLWLTHAQGVCFLVNKGTQLLRLVLTASSLGSLGMSRWVGRFDQAPMQLVRPLRPRDGKRLVSGHTVSLRQTGLRIRNVDSSSVA